MIYSAKFRRRYLKPLRPTIKEIGDAWAKHYEEKRIKKEARKAARAARKANRPNELAKKHVRKRQAKSDTIWVVSGKKSKRN